jgi:uncharacterized protein (UPF0335 family)
MSELGMEKRARRPKSAGMAANVDGARLRPFVDQIVALEQQRRDLAADIKALCADAETAGFMSRAVKVIVKREMDDVEQRAAREALESEVLRLEHALGAFGNTPLGEYALEAAATRQ